MAREKREGSVPFSNATEVDMFIGARCRRCVHRWREDNTFCDEGSMVWASEWPDIIVPSDDTPLGVDCSKFERDESAV